jgi:16S rRNA (uracil1498-N3)-methyltransferase
VNAPRVFVDATDIRADGVTLRGDVAHHVLRRGVGDDASVADGTGAVRHVIIRSIHAGAAQCEAVAEREVAPASPHGVVWEEATQPLRAVAFADGAKQVTVGVGPEGGLTAEEVTTAGLCVSLGMTILRTETAGVVAPALVLHRLGRLG